MSAPRKTNPGINPLFRRSIQGFSLGYKIASIRLIHRGRPGKARADRTPCYEAMSLGGCVGIDRTFNIKYTIPQYSKYGEGHLCPFMNTNAPTAATLSKSWSAFPTSKPIHRNARAVNQRTHAKGCRSLLRSAVRTPQHPRGRTAVIPARFVEDNHPHQAGGLERGSNHASNP